MTEPLACNKEWHAYFVGQGGKMVTRYKGYDIHARGSAFYVNGFYVGTSMRSAKTYINSNT